MNPIFPIIGFIIGAGIGIIDATPVEKRKKYIEKVLIEFIAIFFAVILSPPGSVIFLHELKDHLIRRQEFKQRKKLTNPIWNIKTNEFIEFL